MKQISLSNFNRLRMAGALTLAIVLLSTTLQAATYYVTPTGAGAKNGTSWDNAFGNIQLAIDKAIADSTDEVWVKQGIYKPLALYSPSNANSLTWKSGVNVYGGFAGNETDRSQRSLDAKLTVLDGDNVSRTAILQGFITFKTLTTWSGFTLQNGVSPYYGGIYMYRNMAIDHFIIKDCTNNASGNQSGGGVYITLANAAYTPTDSIIIRNSRIEGNKANYGGGIAIGTASYNTNTVIPTVLIENTEIINNRAAVRGGGIMIEAKAGSEKNVVIRNCVIANNTSGDNVGGGLSVFKVDVEVINTTFANNVAGNWGGGGLYANSVDSLMVTNSIFWNNKDIENGTGSHTILSQGKGLVDSVVIIRNCAFGLALQEGTDVTNNAILENNITLDTLNDGSESGKSYIRFTSPSIAAGYRAGDTSKIADWSLAAGSAAIDAGATVAGLNADIVGRSRPVGSHYDIGAYEYAEPIVIASGATENTAYTQNHGDVVFDAGAGSAGYWTATTPVTNGAIRLVKTFETEKTYAIGFPFAVASVSATEYELKQYDGEANMFGAAYSMEAGKGYLIKFPASLGASVTVTFTSVRNPTLAAAPSLNTGEYALVANGTLQNATSIAGAQNYYPLNSDGTFGAAGSSIVGGLLNPFEAVLATAATADLLPYGSIGAGNDATPTVTLTADNGISVVTPKGITYPYKTVEQFVATFKVASGYTNIRAIVTTEGTSKLDTIPLTTSDTIYTATFSRRAGHTLIRLAADTIRSTVTVNADGVEELSMASGTRVGYFDNVWITFKVRDGYHSPRVAAGSTYKDVKKGANGVDTVFLGAVAANVTVNIAAFRDNTAPVLYDAQVSNAAAASVVVNTTNTTMQLLKNPPTALPYAYVKFDVADAVEGDDYEMIRLRLMTNMVQFASAKELQLQWVSNNLSDGVTPWDNSNFAYDSTTVKDTVSLITVANGQSIVEFIIDNPATIAQIKDSIAAGNRQLSFRVSLNTTDVAGMIVLYTSEGARGSVNDLLNRTPQLIFSKAEY
ncbi:MAG: right-handed parallel beta-helix repeat-containing protein, partial [Prevotellaceae bacterium]|nr:right-handed parallel beta-helix repeat-containing protein [Prevotellaceae bacterium]